MDPNKTLRWLIDALNEGDDERAHEHADALALWLYRSGHMPEVSDRAFYAILTHLRDWCPKKG